jgi:DNA-binding response OmpR family regulator
MAEKTPSGVVLGNILIIEDDPEISDMIVVILAESGYGIRKVGSRDAALKMLGYAVYQWIIMDLMMPGMSAEEFLGIQRKVCPISKVLLITAAENASKEAKRLGIANYLGKPFQPDLLLQMLKSCK